jgi:hypothetical protein
MRLSDARGRRHPTKLIYPDHRLFSVGLAVRASLRSLDDGGPETRRDAPLPAPLRSSPHFLVRSFERFALTQSASPDSRPKRHRVRCHFLWQQVPHLTRDRSNRLLAVGAPRENIHKDRLNPSHQNIVGKAWAISDSFRP